VHSPSLYSKAWKAAARQTTGVKLYWHWRQHINITVRITVLQCVCVCVCVCVCGPWWFACPVSTTCLVQ